MKQIIIVLAMAVVLGSCMEENTNPPFVEDQTFRLDENSPAGTIVGVVSGYELDEGQSFSLRITGGNEAGTFDLDACSGHLSVADPRELDYEAHPELSLEVTATDDHPNDPMETVVTVSIQLHDLNEFPPVCPDQQFSFGPMAAPGDTIALLEAYDPEPQQALLFRIYNGNEEGIFGLSQAGGVLTMVDTAALHASAFSVFNLGVEVRDQHLDSKADSAGVIVEFLRN